MGIRNSFRGIVGRLRGRSSDNAAVAPPAPVEITEQPAPVNAWPAGDGPDGLARIEQDLRGLMRQLAETKFQATEQQRQHSEEVRKLYLSVLEVLDALDRIFRSVRAKEDQVTPQMQKWLGNFRTARSLLEKILTDRAVVRIENLDQGFDPHWHKVAQVVVDTARPEGTIVEEVQRGYVWRGQVLRKAEVIVVRHEEGAEEE
jgi:molecular chaperone GrpE